MASASSAGSGTRLPKRWFLYLPAALVMIMPVQMTLEHHFLYFPEAHHVATPSAVGLPYEEIIFPATDGTQLSGWLIPGRHDAPLILFCMGNAGNISHRLQTLRLLHDLAVNVFIFNYRGYGSSKGKASEKGTYEDISGAMDMLNRRGWQTGKIIIFGRSLGAAVGLEAALRKPPAGLIMEASFTSIAAMGRYHYPALNLLLGWLFGAEYDNKTKISQLQCPLLLIHGTADSICPPFMAEELFARAPQDKQLLWIPEADHNNGFLVGGPTYRDTLSQVIERWTGFSSRNQP